MKNIATIAKKEWRSYLANPAYYAVLVVFLVLWEWLFFRNLFLVGEASVRGLVDLLPWVLLILVPAVTMGSIAGEKENGTLEFVLTHPVREWELVVGKFLGVMGLPVVAILFAVPLAFSISLFGPLDFGVLAGQVAGGIGAASVLAALGIFVSGKMMNQVAALLITVVLGFLLIIGGGDFVASTLPLELAPILEKLTLVSHVQSLARGVVDVRDVWYFVSFGWVVLLLAQLDLLERKYGKNKKEYVKLSGVAVVSVAVFGITNIFGDRLAWRYDLTTNKAYTLSDTTKKVISETEDKVEIILYASGKLPAQYTPVVRGARDVLQDFQRAAKGKLTTSYKDPSADTKVAAEAESAGVQQVQFNVIGQEEFQVKTGFLGLVTKAGDRSETIPFLQDVGDLEYRLTSDIFNLTNKDKKTVAFLEGQGGKNLYSDYQSLSRELAKQFELTTFSKETEATMAATLVIAGPTEKLSDELTKSLAKLVALGKNLVVLLDGVTVNPQFMTVAANKESFGSFIQGYGITINDGVAYDLRFNETVRFGGQDGTGYLLPYPFWMRVATNDNKSIVLPWASGLGVDEKKANEAGYTVNTLVKTSNYSGNKTGEFSLNPDKDTFSSDGLAPKIMGVELQPAEESRTGKIVIMGDSDWLTDQFVQNAGENLNFGLNLISGLTSGEVLSEIRAKAITSGRLMIPSLAAQELLKYGNLGLAVMLPLGVGLVRRFIGRQR